MGPRRRQRRLWHGVRHQHRRFEFYEPPCFHGQLRFPVLHEQRREQSERRIGFSGQNLVWRGGARRQVWFRTLFAVNTNGSGFTNLYTFTATSGSPLTNRDGANPRGSLIVSGGNLYGTAYNGGWFGSGTLFAVSTNGTGFTNLYTFTANSTAPYTNSDGAHPNAALLLSGNTLYGTAYNGGNPGNNLEYGTVFSFTLRPSACRNSPSILPEPM